MPIHFSLNFINLMNEYQTFVFDGPCSHSQLHLKSLLLLSIMFNLYWPLLHLYDLSIQFLEHVKKISHLRNLHRLFPILEHFFHYSFLDWLLIKFQDSVYMSFYLRFLPWPLCISQLPNCPLKLHPVSLALIIIYNYIFDFLIVSLHH